MTAWLAFVLGAAVAVALGVPLAVRQKRRLQEARRRSAAWRADAEALADTLSGMPDGVYHWAHDGQESEGCAARLAVLLGLERGRSSTFEDVLDRFEPEAARSLNSAVATLRREGRPFELVLGLAEEGRSIHAVGRRALDGDGHARLDLVWMRDVTGMLAEAPASGDGSVSPASHDGMDAVLARLPIQVWLRDEALAVQAGSNDRLVDEAARPVAARAAAAGAVASEVRSVAAPEGGRRLLEITEQPMDGGGFLGYAVDVTEREALEAEHLRRASAETAVLENLNAAVSIYGKDMALRYFNSAFSRLWRLDRDWLLAGPTYGEVIERLREARRLPEVADFRAFKDGQIGQFDSLEARNETLWHLPDGATVRVVAAPHPLGGLVFIHEDVTDRLELESSYQTLVAVQRETLDNLYEGIAVFGADGRLRLHNPAFRALWGLDGLSGANEAGGPGPHLADLVDRTRHYYDAGADWEMFKEALIGRLMSRETVSGRLERADGSVVDYAAVPLPDGAVLLSYVDVTDSARVERALRERAKALQTADRLKSEFIANLSYEMRTPLNTIQGFAEILAEEYFGRLSKRQKEYARGILDSSQTVVSLLTDTIDLATIEAGQMALELDTVELHTALVGVLGLIRERARRRQIDLQFDVSPEIGWIVGDERRLRQVFYHLLSNAVKFTRPGGSVTLSAHRTGDEVLVSVSDTGIGIPQADQDRVFGSFQRGTTPEARQSGAGLGLTLVKRFIELHGGRVDLDSTPNKGTTVTCHLPGA